MDAITFLKSVPRTLDDTAARLERIADSADPKFRESLRRAAMAVGRAAVNSRKHINDVVGWEHEDLHNL